MKAWSQTVYGVAHALHIARSINFGNLATVEESLSQAEQWCKSNLGFESNLPALSFKKNSINLQNSDHDEIFANLSSNVTKVLFIGLATLIDESLTHLISKHSSPPNTLTPKIQWIESRIPAKYSWASNGLFELCALRNALVHNAGRHNQSSIDILSLAGITTATNNHLITISFGDLFRYRRAFRTICGELLKLRKKSEDSKPQQHVPRSEKKE